MKKGRPRKLGIWSAKLLKLYHYLGYDINVLAKRFGISKRTIYRYTTKGGRHANDKTRLYQNSKSSKKP